MPEQPALSRFAIAELEGLKKQFDALLLTHVNNRHLYVEYPAGAMPLLEPPRDGGFGVLCSTAIYETAHAVFHEGRWLRLHRKEAKGTRNWAGWYQGSGIPQFDLLAGCVDSFLTTHPIQIPRPPEIVELLGEFAFLPTDSIILPCGFQRWTRILHWLAWSGDVMRTSRFCFDEASRKPCTYSLNPALKLSSIVDNLFLRSSIALDWIMDRFSRGSGVHEEVRPIEVAKPRKKQGGRPADTDPDQDRRIADAWRTGMHKSREALANVLGMPKSEVLKALDRHRKRDGKTPKQKSRQER